jgi:alkylglycerol monooxygenase
METLFATLVSVAIISAIIEYVALYKKEKASLPQKEIGLNIKLGIIGVLVNVLVKGLQLSLYYYAYQHAPVIIENKILAILLAVILYDFVTYWFHRLSHTYWFLWASHITHHSAEHYNLTITFRVPLLVSFFKFIFWAPLAFCGISVEYIMLASFITKLYAYFLHTNFFKSYGIFDYVFTAPVHHQVHHASNPEYLDKNFGELFIIWDRMFGTFCRHSVEPVFGVTEKQEINTIWKACFGEYERIMSSLKKTSGILNKVKVIFSRIPQGSGTKSFLEG